MTMTDEELARIEKLCQSATPGPWSCNNNALCDGKSLYVEGHFEELLGCNITIVEHDHAYCSDECAANMTFIAESRTAVPALIAEVRRLQGENARLRKAIDDALKTYQSGMTPTHTKNVMADVLRKAVE